MATGREERGQHRINRMLACYSSSSICLYDIQHSLNDISNILVSESRVQRQAKNSQKILVGNRKILGPVVVLVPVVKDKNWLRIRAPEDGTLLRLRDRAISPGIGSPHPLCFATYRVFACLHSSITSANEDFEPSISGTSDVPRKC